MIYYHDGNGNMTGAIYYHDPGYDPACNGPHFVEHPEYIAAHRVHFYQGEDGTMCVREKADLAISLDANPVVLGTEAVFRNVPEGAVVFVNDERLGEMDDASGLLEITPETAGHYRVRVEMHAYVPYEVTLEVCRPT